MRRWMPFAEGAWAVGCLALWLGAARPAAGAPLLLDFGTPASPLRTDFVRVTEAGAGGVAAWSADADLSSIATPILRESTYNESSGRSNPPANYATELSCDHVRGAADTTLTVSLPPGPYVVWLLCGAAGEPRAQVWDITVHCGASTATATFAGGQEIRTLQLQGEADANGLRLGFATRSRWLVNAAVVAPRAEWPEVERTVVGPIHGETFLLPPDVPSQWKEVPHAEVRTAPAEWPAVDRERGFVVFHRHYLEPVWPNSVPSRDECQAPVRAFAALNEYEPLTFSILPLRDLPALDLEIGDLTTADGRVIPRSHLDLRFVRYMVVRPNYLTTGVYYEAPDVLMPWTPQPLRAGRNLTVWLTVRTGPAIQEGLYGGTVRLLSGGQVLHEVPLLLRVIPLLLQQDRSLTYGQYYHHPYRQMSAAPDPFSRRWWATKAELEHADMAAHGNNALVLGLGGRQVGDRWDLDFDGLGRCLELYNRYGFYQPVVCSFPVSSLYGKHMKGGMGSHLRLVKMPPQEFFDEVTALVRTIEDERRRRLWPELLYYPVDEPSTAADSVQFMTAVLKAIKEVPGVRTYVTADPAHDEFIPMKPYVDVWCCQPFSLERETVLADMSARRVEYWCYPNHVAGENDHTPWAGARMTYGFGFWRSGFRALTPWIYQAIVGDQWNYLDGSSMDFFNRTADDASPIPVAQWEAYREGIDDGRYITTLERTIERAKTAGLRQLAADAETDLQWVAMAINVQPKYFRDGLWQGESFDVYRWLLASRILELEAALKP